LNWISFRERNRNEIFLSTANIKCGNRKIEHLIFLMTCGNEKLSAFYSQVKYSHSSLFSINPLIVEWSIRQELSNSTQSRNDFKYYWLKHPLKYEAQENLYSICSFISACWYICNSLRLLSSSSSLSSPIHLIYITFWKVSFDWF
jgi:hypothetical protein